MHGVPVACADMSALCFVTKASHHSCEALATDIAYSSLLAFTDIVNCGL